MFRPRTTPDPALAGVVAAALERARDLAGAFERVLALDLADAFERDPDSALIDGLALVRELAGKCVGALPYEPSLESDIFRLLQLEGALDLDRDHDVIVERALEYVSHLIHVLQRALASSDARSQPGETGQTVVVLVRPAGGALRIHRFAVSLLSPEGRARHEAELLDELIDLADQHQSRGQQIACALRQLTMVRQLRAAACAERRSTGSISGAG